MLNFFLQLLPDFPVIVITDNQIIQISWFISSQSCVSVIVFVVIYVTSIYNALKTKVEAKVTVYI